MEIQDYVVTYMCNKCTCTSSASSFGTAYRLEELKPFTKTERSCPFCHSGKVTLAKMCFKHIGKESAEKNELKDRAWRFGTRCLNCANVWSIKLTLMRSADITPQRPNAVCPKCGEEHRTLFLSAEKEA